MTKAPTKRKHAFHAMLRAASDAVPPAWPLEASVAVNPFMGMGRGGAAGASARLADVAGTGATMPRRWFAGEIAAGTIGDADLAAAIAADGSRLTVADLKSAAAMPVRPRAPLPTVADVATACSGVDWTAIVADRIGGFAAAHFDRGQAFWPGPGGSAWNAWRATAMHDLSPEIAGLRGFAGFVRDLPDDVIGAAERAIERLAVPVEAREIYCHRLLVTLGGWAQLARHRQWQAELVGGKDATVTEFLTVRLVWELALLELSEPAVAAAWCDAVTAYGQTAQAHEFAVETMLQYAADHASQKLLADALSTSDADPGAVRPLVQAAFCIDVRSEIMRRALEAQDPAIETLGFAGFFGMATAHRRAGSDTSEARLPALLAPALRSKAQAADGADAELRVRARAARAWGRFRLAAVSCFAFVEATGPLYAAKLVRDCLALPGGPPVEPTPAFDPMPDAAQQVAMAEGVLRGMSLIADFALLVLIVGHGADVVNNPHAAGLQCGACGGYKGDVSARLLCRLLNDPVVRLGLDDRGIFIPWDTLFVAGLHDTTSDEVTLFDGDLPTSSDPLIVKARKWLEAASAAARTERARRLPSAGSGQKLLRRGRDWSQVRQEWGLAGCHAFIAAPRHATRGRDLGGRCFLHSYDRALDPDLSVLEAILTAPVVVASWISLQYHGSTVAPDLFGSGNKLLHNAVGGVGVLEGVGGPMRAGLPWQSVSDGIALAHRPVRLSVCIAAGAADIDAVLERHASVRALFDDRWLHLFSMDDAGALAQRYVAPGVWASAFADSPADIRVAA